MTELDLDQLFAIAELSPALDGVEDRLRRAGHVAQADALNKLQRDAGVAIDRALGGDEADEVPPGPQTARLVNGYEPVTAARAVLFREIQLLLPDADSRDILRSLMNRLPPETASPSSGSAPKLP